MEDNNVLAKYLLWASMRSTVVSASASLLKCRDGKQSQALFAHSWLRILTGFHLTGADRDGRPKAGVWLSVAVNDHCVGSWASNVVTTCIISSKIIILPPPTGCSLCGSGRRCCGGAALLTWHTDFAKPLGPLQFVRKSSPQPWAAPKHAQVINHSVGLLKAVSPKECGGRSRRDLSSCSAWLRKSQ